MPTQQDALTDDHVFRTPDNWLDVLCENQGPFDRTGAWGIGETAFILLGCLRAATLEKGGATIRELAATTGFLPLAVRHSIGILTFHYGFAEVMNEH